jgi:glycosyltransferase involved in cell wall biosynthesis
MRILTALTYYRPHTSGLTIYAERLARALVDRGHEVTVLTSRFEPELPLEEIADGVRVLRVPVAARIGKGVLMPTLGLVATREVLSHDVQLLHLPQFDAAGLALRGRLFRRPTVLTYHCDLLLPPGLFNRFVNTTVHAMNHLAARSAHRIVAYTDDFAAHSPYLTRYADKRVVILPPVELPPVSRSLEPRGWVQSSGPVIGMATRLASEKGVEVLLDALPFIVERFPNARILFAGQHEGVWGEQEYADRLRPRIEEQRAAGRWTWLGILSPAEMASFFEQLDLLVVPSLNSTESFGLIQIEAMMKGKPAVASDLPGVRQPVRMTGMGEVVAVGDAEALAEAVVRVLEGPERYAGNPKAVAERFHPARCAEAYEDLFLEIAAALGRRPIPSAD